MQVDKFRNTRLIAVAQTHTVCSDLSPEFQEYLVMEFTDPNFDPFEISEDELETMVEARRTSIELDCLGYVFDWYLVKAGEYSEGERYITDLISTGKAEKSDFKAFAVKHLPESLAA